MNVQLLQDKSKHESTLLADISEYFSHQTCSTNLTHRIEVQYRSIEAEEAKFHPEVQIKMKGLLLILLTFLVSVVHGAPIRTYPFVTEVGRRIETDNGQP